MALINHTKREINAKLVYYGPASSGKGTNLNFIYRNLKPQCKGKLKTMKVDEGRMLFFDFTPLPAGSMNGYNLRFHVFTLTGETTASAPWKMVLKGVDGIVFVADADPSRTELNRKSIRSLQEHLAQSEAGLEIPLVIQCNKSDVPGARDPEVVRSELASVKVPVHSAAAAKGEGVVETLTAIVKLVQAKLVEDGLTLEQEASPVQEGKEEAFTAGRAAEEPPVEAEAAEAEYGIEGMAEISEEPTDTAAPTVELAGPVEGGAEALRVPLTIRCGGTERRFTLTVSLSEEPVP